MAMTKTIQATVKNRTDTAANWTQKNPVLAEGEIIVVQTNAGETRLKIGDGVKTFTQLPYTDEQIYNNVVTSVNGQTGDVTLANDSKSLGLASAAVGQIPKIKAVDSNGVPTEWEAADMASGADGKSAYAYAVEGGYTGTEEEFTEKLAEEIPTVDDTLTQSGQAADASVIGNRLSALSEEIVTTSESKVAAHNTGTDTHSDIRLLIQGLTDRLNALADSDDTTLDQLSEVVAYIKSNRSLIEAITTSKVSVADIIDNLTTNVSNKPLSAAQGVALKALIDAISIPDALPNPNALTFSGAVTGSYDGSEPVTINIPESGAGNMKKLTFTGAVTGEYDGTTDVSIDIPIATSSAAGIIKVGNGLSISADGTLSVTTATYYTGTADPVNTLGADGDLYLKTEG